MRILFVKTSSLGDVVHHCAAVSDVARALPDARIDWMLEEAFAPVARMHRAVRRAIPVAVRRWRARLWQPAVWREIAALRDDLARQPYDVVIDTQGLVKSALLARLARGTRHGYDRASAREPLAARFYDRCHGVRRDLHAVERNRALSAAALALPAPQGCDYGLVAPALAQGGWTDAPRAPYAVLLTMSSRADKLWPEAHWRALVAALEARGLCPVLPWGSAAERARGARIAGSGAAARVPPALTLGALARLFTGAGVVVGVDTGLSHLAHALGAPTLALYGSTDPARTGLHGGARGRNLGAPGRFPALDEVLAALEGVLR